MPLYSVPGLDNFYPRPPRGGRPGTDCASSSNRRISIHALREEGDREQRPLGAGLAISIHALREEGDPEGCRGRNPTPRISIHALREEGDYSIAERDALALYFYPRPPRGGRHPILPHPPVSVKFLSTPSARRATPLAHRAQPTATISIHALREEGDYNLVINGSL